MHNIDFSVILLSLSFTLEIKFREIDRVLLIYFNAKNILHKFDMISKVMYKKVAKTFTLVTLEFVLQNSC